MNNSKPKTLVNDWIFQQIENQDLSKNVEESYILILLDDLIQGDN